MLAKDSVQPRLARGLSFTEFSYMTLQAADFLHLYRAHGVEMQMGGADQWGNITAGLELIRRVEEAEEGDEPHAFGLCSPLLLTADGREDGQDASRARCSSTRRSPARTTSTSTGSTSDDLVARAPALADAAGRRRDRRRIEAEQAAQPERRPGQRALRAST